MTDIYYINRKTKEKEKELVYGKGYLEFLYGKNPLGRLVRPLLCEFSTFSRIYGEFQKRAESKGKIKPFIKKYNVDSSEFLEPVETFGSFNDFFTRRLRPSSRPIFDGNDWATLPADGRYLAYRDIAKEEGFLVKGKKFSLEKLLGDKKLAHKYAEGSMVMARLAPVDYHRFHFPCNCVPENVRLINGSLYSVNPLALRQNIEILTENKRYITELKTESFGTVLTVEVGATYVGAVHQTYEPGKEYAKGDEKGYFSFGGSCLILIFPPFRIQFDQDLLDATGEGFETLAYMGESMGRALPAS